MADVRVVIDPAAVAAFVRDPSGPVFRRLVEDGEVVKAGAQRRVGVYRPPPGENRQRAGGRTPGTLRDRIVKRVVPDPAGFAVMVGAEDPVALIHHEGTVPHEIRPVRAPRLAFRLSDGTLVFALRVSHPGTQPNRYLTDSLEDLRSRY